MVEPISILTALGLLTVKEAGTFLFSDVLLPLVQDASKDYVKDFFKTNISHLASIGNLQPLQKAASQAIKEFLLLFQEELEYLGIDRKEIKKLYINSLKKFVYNDKVKAILGKAFDSNCHNIDITSLQSIWQELNLPYLPENFDWEQIGKSYLRKVKGIIKESDQLRSILDSENLQAIRSVVEDQAPISVDFDMQKYKESIKEFYGYLKLDNLHTSGYEYRIALWKMFIPQLAKASLPIIDIPKDYLRELEYKNQLEELEELENYRLSYVNAPIYSVLEIIADTNFQYIVILGDPGSGKSTLTQYVCLNWIEQGFQGIPLLIELRKYVKDRNLPKNFLDFFHQGSDAICHLNRNQLHQELTQGNVLVMFDGLDEVFDNALRDSIITEIIRFTNQYKKVRVIVTSRIIGYKPQALRDAQFKHFTLQDLEWEQITKFIEKWHTLAFGNHPDKLRLQTRLGVAINDSPAIRELAGNPLLLTMIAILNRNQELPRDRVELYEQASRVLLQEWDVGKNLPIPVDTIGRQEKQAMLRKVAYFMQSNVQGLKGNLIQADDLEKIFRDYLKNIEVASPHEIAKLIIKQLRERNFILCFLGANTYGFVHRTFLEYFCAWELVWRFEKERTIDLDYIINEIFGKNWQDQSWHELLKLITAMIEPKFVNKIIDYLIKLPGEDFEFINLYLATDCLFEVRNKQDLKEISEILLNSLMKLTEYGNWSETKLDKDEKDMLIKIRSLTIEKIARTWRDKSTILPWLKSFLEPDFSAKYAFIPYAALRAIAHNWQHEPDTLPLIKKCCRYALNKFVRQSAVLELGRLWREDPETFTILVNTLQNDSTPDVRWTVIRVIGQYFSEHPQTKLLIQDSCFDENFYVRDNAIKYITNWYKEAEIRNLLFYCAKNDAFVRTHPWEDNPRQRAVEAIIKYYPQHPETCELVEDRLINDPDEKLKEFIRNNLDSYNLQNIS